MAKSKLPKDANQRAIVIAQIATGEIEDKNKIDDGKNAAAVAFRTFRRFDRWQGKGTSLTPEYRK